MGRIPRFHTPPSRRHPAPRPVTSCSHSLSPLPPQLAQLTQVPRHPPRGLWCTAKSVPTRRHDPVETKTRVEPHTTSAALPLHRRSGMHFPNTTCPKARGSVHFFHTGKPPGRRSMSKLLELEWTKPSGTHPASPHTSPWPSSSSKTGHAKFTHVSPPFSHNEHSLHKCLDIHPQASGVLSSPYQQHFTSLRQSKHASSRTLP